MPEKMAKAYEPKKYEDIIYKNWEKRGFFNPDKLNLKKDAASFTIVLPPPNVTGTLHMGHAGMLAIEDVMARFQRMNGKKTLWLPGTDHAAIATQAKVEKILKKEGTGRHKLGKEKFLERVKKFSEESHDTIVGQCKKMGASLDWSREAYTLDETRNRAVNSVFKLMYDDGLIYRGERIVNWCPKCHSTLADDEVEHKRQKAKLYYFKYSKDFPITIATTRPETKLGDTAVAVNPKDRRYKDLIGKEYNVDFAGVPLKIKVIADREVDMEFGAGALGVTPAHSAVDWQMAEKNDLKIIKIIDEDGNIKEGMGEYSFKSVKDAREMIIEKLEKAGLLEKTEDIDNNLSICYRCDTAVEPLPSLQWFIDVNKRAEKLGNKSIKEVCLEAVKKGVFGKEAIRIIPERFQKNYFHWMNDLRDWCISRQIWFGHQAPVWYKSNNEGKEEVFVGVDAPEGEGWVRDEDTLDTWFSSGMWTFSTLAHAPEDIKIEDGKLLIDSEDFKNYHPTQVLETGYDILFFWVARMIIMTTYALNDIPFENVYLHGLVLDDKGKKMSKSKDNVIDPLDMIEKYGADATRLSLIVGSSPGNDMRLSEEKVAGFRNLVNKLWNIARFTQHATHNTQHCNNIDYNNLSLADKYILGKLEELIKEISENLENYKFSQAGEKLRAFTWSNLADWYLEATKFDKSEEKGKVLRFVLENLLKLWHPFIPFVTEAIWQEMGKEKDLIVSKWPVYENKKIKELKPHVGKFGLLQDVIEAVRNARAENKIEPGRKIKAVIYAGKNVDIINDNKALIKGMRTGIEEIDARKTGKEIESAIKVVIADILVYLTGAKDEAKEKARIAKRKEELGKAIANIKKKLNNRDFIKKAPENIVKKEEEKLSLYKKELNNN